MRPSLDPPSALISSCERSLTPVPLIVLDTNVVLDWLLFADPGVQALASAIEQGRLRWIATAAMRGEFFHVLGRGLAMTHAADPAQFDPTWARLCVEHPTAPLAAAPLRCTDTDDQKFIDLALAAGARWLVSRDRALLKLRTKAATRGVTIVTPSEWRDRAEPEMRSPTGPGAELLVSRLR
jgi:predicted nucleic acid-binding protein